MSGDAAAKKPPTAYFLWFNQAREGIQKEVGAKDFKSVAGKASELWKAMSEQDKKPFEEEAAKLKDAFNKFKETDEGKAALAAKKEEKQGKKAVLEKRAIKAAVKSVEKDDKLKKPTSAYWMWLNDTREQIRAALGEGHKITDVSKKGGEMWKALSDADKEPWEKKAKAAKDAHEEYLKSPEGEAALKAYKEAAKAAKCEATGKPIDEPKSPDAKTPETKKRAREPKKADSPASGKVERAVKKPRGAKEAPKDILSEEMVVACRAATKAGEPSMEGMLRKLLETDKLAGKGLTPEQGLDALKSSGGLLNKARGMLVARLGA
jgi:hypothetical protein